MTDRKFSENQAIRTPLRVRDGFLPPSKTLGSSTWSVSLIPTIQNTSNHQAARNRRFLQGKNGPKRPICSWSL